MADRGDSLGPTGTDMADRGDSLGPNVRNVLIIGITGSEKIISEQLEDFGGDEIISEQLEG